MFHILSLNCLLLIKKKLWKWYLNWKKPWWKSFWWPCGNWGARVRSFPCCRGRRPSRSGPCRCSGPSGRSRSCRHPPSLLLGRKNQNQIRYNYFYRILWERFWIGIFMIIIVNIEKKWKKQIQKKVSQFVHLHKSLT